MKIFERYISNDLNQFSSKIFELFLKLSRKTREKFEFYKKIDDYFKSLILIKESEKEIEKNPEIEKNTVKWVKEFHLTDKDKGQYCH